MSTAATYKTSPIKRPRRTRGDIEAIKQSLHEVVSEHHPVTCRQAFYLLVSRQVIDKTEAEYKSTVCRLLAEMRRAGEIPFGWVADSTRWMRKPRTHVGTHCPNLPARLMG